MESNQLKTAARNKHNAAYYFAVGYNAASEKDIIDPDTFAYAYRNDYVERVNGTTKLFPSVSEFAKVYIDSFTVIFPKE